jgi:hypothetical protein
VHSNCVTKPFLHNHDIDCVFHELVILQATNVRNLYSTKTQSPYLIVYTLKQCINFTKNNTDNVCSTVEQYVVTYKPRIWAKTTLHVSFAYLRTDQRVDKKRSEVLQ